MASIIYYHGLCELYCDCFSKKTLGLNALRAITKVAAKICSTTTSNLCCQN